MLNTTSVKVYPVKKKMERSQFDVETNDLYWIELLEIELFGLWTVFKQMTDV